VAAVSGHHSASESFVRPCTGQRHGIAKLAVDHENRQSRDVGTGLAITGLEQSFRPRACRVDDEARANVESGLHLNRFHGLHAVTRVPSVSRRSRFHVVCRLPAPIAGGRAHERRGTKPGRTVHLAIFEPPAAPVRLSTAMSGNNSRVSFLPRRSAFPEPGVRDLPTCRFTSALSASYSTHAGAEKTNGYSFPCRR